MNNHQKIRKMRKMKRKEKKMKKKKRKRGRFYNLTLNLNLPASYCTCIDYYVLPLFHAVIHAPLARVFQNSDRWSV